MSTEPTAAASGVQLAGAAGGGDGIPTADRARAIRILPVAAIVFLGLMPMGIPLAVIPLQVHRVLGYDTLVVGLVMGIESVATLASRPWTGRICDRRGAKPAMLIGLSAAALSGVAYWLSAALPLPAWGSLAVLVLGRILMGIGEGLIFTSGSTWPISLLGMAHAGKALAWIGVAMFGGIAAGTALGTLVNDSAGFGTVAIATALIPAVGLAIAGLAPAVPAVAGEPMPLGRVIGRIWRAGGGFLLSSVGYAAVSSFLVLAFDERGWSGGGYALATFGAGYVASRILFGGLADASRGKSMVVATLSAQAAGLVLLWLAPNPAVAFLGAAISGLGNSMVYPLLALPAIRRVPPANIGVAIGTYDACFDIALMLATPVCGALAVLFPIQSVFLVAAIAVALAINLAVAAYRHAGQPA